MKRRDFLRLGALSAASLQAKELDGAAQALFDKQSGLSANKFGPFYVNVKLKAGCEAKFEEILKEIVPASRKDKGCISYECGVVTGTKSEYCFMESWENLESQKEHMKSAHMVKNAAALEACKESQEVKIINFVSVKE